MADENLEFISSFWFDLNLDKKEDVVDDRKSAEMATTMSLRKQADKRRNVVKFLDKMKRKNLIKQDLYVALVSSTQEKYTTVVDSMKEKEGLNNYAAAVMNIVSGQRNDSKSWCSSLTFDGQDPKPSFLQDILDKAKAENSNQETLLKYLAKARKTKQAPTSCRPVNENTERVQSKDSDTLRETHSFAQQTAVMEAQVPMKTTSVSPIENGTKPAKDMLATSRSDAVMSHSHQSNNSFNFKPTNEEMRRQPLFEASTASKYQPTFAKRKYPDTAQMPNKQVKITTNSFPERDQDHLRYEDGHRQRSFKFHENQSKSDNSWKKRSNGIIYRKDRRNGRNNFNSLDEDESDDEDQTKPTNTFMTARDQYMLNQRRKNKLGSSDDSRSIRQSDYGQNKKSLGTRRGTTSKFIPPVMNRDTNGTTSNNRSGNHGSPGLNSGKSDCQDERLKNVEPRMIEMIENEIMDHGPPISWDDIAGLEFAKNTIQEIVIWPMLRPDIFTGLRGPPKGLLLFGPPGTGKTLIGKCIASQSHATFFSISASSLTSKWIGEGEKMVRALFAVARCQESAVIFIDEIDSLLSQRTDGEHEATRRIKTEFLVQLDGATTKAEDRILVVGATNRPQELDEAARRRLVKRLYIPLPEASARRHIVCNLMREQVSSLNDEEYSKIEVNSDGYSGADMANLCREAALGPIRSISLKDIRHIKSDEVRPISYRDFEDAFRNIRPSVSQHDLEVYTQWNKSYGSGGF